MTNTFIEFLKDIENLQLFALCKDFEELSLDADASFTTSKSVVVMLEFAPICISLVISLLVSLILLGLPFLFSSNPGGGKSEVVAHMARKGNPISVRRYLNRSSYWRKEFLSTQLSFFRNALLSFLKKTKYSVFSFDFNHNDILLFFLKIGYLTCFFVLFTFSYSRIFPTIEEENYTRAFQVFLQLSLFLFHFRRFTTKEEKEGKWLLLLSVFYSVVATLFLKNLVSLEVLLFIVVPVFCFCLVRLPSDVIPFASLLFYSLERGLAQWAFFLLFQLVAYFGLCFFLEDRPKKAIVPLLITLIFFWIIGKIHYSADFLHESARLTAMVSGACIIFLCFRRRKKIAFLSAFSIYFVLSTGIGVISIASAPGGDNISYPIPFLFILCHVVLFLGLFLFQRNIRAERQPLVPLLFGALLFFLPYFPTLEWLEGWIEGLDFFLLLLGILLFVCGEENE